MSDATAEAATEREFERGSDRQVVVFRLGTEKYGVDIGRIREIIRRPQVTHLPAAPESVEGVINLRGQVIPIVDLCRRLDLGVAETSSDSRVVVLEVGDVLVGAIVDEVTRVLRVSGDAIAPTASILSGEQATFVEHIAKVGEELLLLLELDRALDAESMQSFQPKSPPPSRGEQADGPPHLRIVGSEEGTADETADEQPGDDAGDDVGDEPAGLPFDVGLVETTFEALAPQGEAIVTEFYERLFDRHPEVVTLFEHTDMDEQRAKLLSALATVVATLRRPDELVPHLQRLGERHVDYGAEPAHYNAVGEALLETLEHIAGEAWTPEVAAAWAGAYAVAADVMAEAGEALRTSRADEAVAAVAESQTEAEKPAPKRRASTRAKNAKAGNGRKAVA